MPKVEFMVHYKNGQIGVSANAGDVLDLTKKEIQQISSDMRNPEEGMRLLGKQKKKGLAGLLGGKEDKPADDES